MPVAYVGTASGLDENVDAALLAAYNTGDKTREGISARIAQEGADGVGGSPTFIVMVFYAEPTTGVRRAGA
jgi:2-hydroxychromene-2-carboxylate isomerase